MPNTVVSRDIPRGAVDRVCATNYASTSIGLNRLPDVKAAVSSPNGLELRDIPQPAPNPNEVNARKVYPRLNKTF
jgi:hypothetical protein